MSAIRWLLLQDPRSDPLSAELAAFDATHATPITIDAARAHVHAQESFMCGYTDVAMADTDTFILAFKTPAGTKRIHFFVEFASLAGCHLDIYKDSTWDNQSGAKNPVYNRFQLDTPASSGILEDQAQAGFVASNNIITDPTGHVAGSKIVPTHYLFGSNKGSHGTHAMLELVLEVDTQHTLVLTTDGANNAGTVFINWAEHTDS